MQREAILFVRKGWRISQVIVEEFKGALVHYVVLLTFSYTSELKRMDPCDQR